MPRRISRRTFLKSTSYAFMSSVALAALSPISTNAAAGYDLLNDSAPLAALPSWFQERARAPEATGPLSESYYAAHVWLVAATPFLPENGFGAGLGHERVLDLLAAVNEWATARLRGRRLRFIVHEERRSITSPSDDTEARAQAVLELGRSEADYGAPQRIFISLVDGLPDLAFAAPGIVLLGWPADQSGAEVAAAASALAHLIGHALGLDHPRGDIDTAGTRFASEHSFMHPSAATRGLSESLILESPLNPQKGRLLWSGFFPRGGDILTEAQGGIPLTPGMVIAGKGRTVRIAHGNYILPARKGQAAVVASGPDLVVDLGGALVRGDAAAFEEFGAREAHGTGIRLEGPGDVTLRGGIVSGYCYGVKADGLVGGRIEGVTLLNNRRLQSDARRAGNDPLRGGWLDFWLTPEEDGTEAWVGSVETKNLYATTGAGLLLRDCRATACRGVIATHNTVGVADYYGRSNAYEDNDLGGCAIGLRFWQAGGEPEQPILVAGNTFRFNNQPERWWWSQGDSAAIAGPGLRHCAIRGNEIAFGGDGLFLSGFPRMPGQTQSILVEDNDISYSYAHGVEIDFGQDCVLRGNRIAANWLSGVWAGHTAGILFERNRFVRNNRGRMFAGWTDSQGAISCPQGRAVVVGNTFEENWVAVNLREAVFAPWWLFAGDAADHVVAGNTFRSNQVAVRLSGVRASTVADNLMLGNAQDLSGNLQDNNIGENGPDADPARSRVVFFPVQTLLLDAVARDMAFRLITVGADGGQILAPDEVTAHSSDGEPWIETAVLPDAAVRVRARTGVTGIRSGAVEISAGGRKWRVPVKLMAGDFLVSITAGQREPQPESGAEGMPGEPDQRERAVAYVGPTSAGPAAIMGWFSRLGDALRTGRDPGLIAAEPFFCRFSQPFAPMITRPGAFVAMVTTDGPTALSLTDAGPDFASKTPAPDEGWAWSMGNINAEVAATRFVFDYTRRVDAVESGVPACVTLWLYPLDEADLAKQPRAAATSDLRTARNEHLMSMPGSRRRLEPPAAAGAGDRTSLHLPFITR